jgi:HEPN domain-containing protein
MVSSLRVLSRADFQDLARTRVTEARALLRGGHYGGAYYLAGYAIECALKACIAKRTRRYDFPDRKTVNESHSHNLSDLLRVAGLERELTQDSASDTRLSANWAVVKDWNESSRYGVFGRVEASDLVQAVAGQGGILQWLRQHW